MDIKMQVLHYITLHPGCSYVELERFFDEIGFEWRGDMAVQPREPARCLLDRMESIYGKCLTLPIVKVNRIYKTDHWLPVVFSVAQRTFIVGRLEYVVFAANHSS